MTGLNFKTLEIQNFKSFGEKKTTLNIDSLKGLTLFLGDNEDAPSPDSRNGVGKSTILDCIAFVFTGKTIKKRRDTSGVINKINGKKCLVSLDFDFNGLDCRIERGLKPGVLRYFEKHKDDPSDLTDPKNDLSQTGPETQKHIYNKFKLDIDLIRFILISAAKTDNFFQMDSAEQKRLVEVLFGFESLTVKAADIKERRQKEELKFQLENSRLQEQESAQKRFVTQLENISNQYNLWEDTHKSKLTRLSAEVKELEGIDYDGYAEAFNYFKTIKTQIADQNTLISNVSFRISEIEKDRALNTVKQSSLLRWLNAYDATTVDTYIANTEIYLQAKEELSEVETARFQLNTQFQQTVKTVNRLKTDISHIQENCPTCGQSWPDVESRQQKITALQAELAEHQKVYDEIKVDLALLDDELAVLKTKATQPSHPLFKTVDEAKKAQFEYDTNNMMLEEVISNLLNLEHKVEALVTEKTALEVVLSDLTKSYAEINDLDIKSEVELTTKKSKLENTKALLSSAQDETNPHSTMMESLKNETINQISFEVRDSLEDNIKHMQYLEKLLTKKDSPIRRLVISKWLPKLNELMAHYLTASELPYTVIFNDDLTATINDFEIQMDFADLSSGEEERVSMALCWAFRDVFENINYPINFMGIDERLDAGLDGAGGQSSINILYEMAATRGRNTFLVSHRSELIDYADQIIMVKKKGRFSKLERAL